MFLIIENPFITSLSSFNVCQAEAFEALHSGYDILYLEVSHVTSYAHYSELSTILDMIQLLVARETCVVTNWLAVVRGGWWLSLG